MYEAEINIKSQMLADFLRYIFPPAAGSELCRVSTTRPTGMLIVALAEPAALPVNVSGDHVVKLDIPWSRNATSALENHWILLDKNATARINTALEAEFDLEFAGYYRRGEQLGMKKMEIIDAFILSRGLAATTYDTLHKRTYRKELLAQERTRQQLLRRAYYINESIDYEGLFEK